MTRLMSSKQLNEKLKTLIKKEASHKELWEVCGGFVKNNELTKDEVYNLLMLHVQSPTISNEMEEKMLDLLDLYSGYCSSECKLY